MTLRTALMAVLAVVVLTIVTPALAKSPPDKLVVEGGGLAAPVEIRNEAALAEFSPWSRGFIDWSRGPARQPATPEPLYTVSFHLDGETIYVVEYVPVGGEGYVYFPGGGHPAHELNLSTIITGSSDFWNPNGRWAHATRDWNEVVQCALLSDAAIQGASVADRLGSGSERAAAAAAEHCGAGAAVTLWVGGGLLAAGVVALAWCCGRDLLRPTL